MSDQPAKPRAISRIIRPGSASVQLSSENEAASDAASDRMAAMWKMTLEAYGLDPNNPPKMRKDVVRIIRTKR